jgi:hypothetical protein
MKETTFALLPVCSLRKLALIVLLLVGAAWGQSPAPAASEFLYLPPAWENRVVFYQAFEQGVNKPEINILGARIQGAVTAPAEGLAGRGYTAPNYNVNQTPLSLITPGLSAHRPLTLMCWWRLDAPMAETTCFSLLGLSGSGFIASFVRGKGDWCGLTQPTCISQVYNFPGIANHNNPWGGRAWFAPGEWHHVAITVAGAQQVAIYWDGRLRETILIKGRLLREGDTSRADIGTSWLYHPMTLDDLIVVDRALTADEIADYVLAIRSLRDHGMPVSATTSSPNKIMKTY